jgi:hypothetical protein
MPEHREKCSNRYRGGPSHLQHNTPPAVRCRSTRKNVPTAPAAAPDCRHGTSRLWSRPYGPAGRRLDRGATRELRGPPTHRPSFLVTPPPVASKSSSPTRNRLLRSVEAASRRLRFLARPGIRRGPPLLRRSSRPLAFRFRAAPSRGIFSPSSACPTRVSTKQEIVISHPGAKSGQVATNPQTKTSRT